MLQRAAAIRGGRTALIQRVEEAFDAIPAALDLSAPTKASASAPS